MNIENTNKTNTICLNSLKFFAACIVAFVWHYQHFKPQAGSPFSNLFAYSYPHGWLMVELFFMLSGFGMMVGYGDKIINHHISFAPYIRKRINKVYPLFFITLILVVILQLMYKSKIGSTFVYPNFDLYHFFLNLVLCHDGLFVTDWSFNSPSWCISICLILYFIFFAVFYFSKDKKSAVYKFICLGLIGIFVLKMRWNYPILNALVARGLSCFSMGVFLAYIYQHEHLFNKKLIGYLCMILLIGSYVIYRVNPDVIGDMQMLFILFIAPMIILCTIFVPWFNKLLSFKFFTYLGSLSIEIYLLHFIIQCVIVNIDVYFKLKLNYSSQNIWCIYAMSTILVSILYKQVFEKKCSKLFTKICNRILVQ